MLFLLACHAGSGDGSSFGVDAASTSDADADSDSDVDSDSDADSDADTGVGWECPISWDGPVASVASGAGDLVDWFAEIRLCHGGDTDAVWGHVQFVWKNGDGDAICDQVQSIASSEAIGSGDWGQWNVTWTTPGVEVGDTFCWEAGILPMQYQWYATIGIQNGKAITQDGGSWAVIGNSYIYPYTYLTTQGPDGMESVSGEIFIGQWMVQ